MTAIPRNHQPDTNMPNTTKLEAPACVGSADGSDLFVIECDEDPQPFEDWSFPLLIVRGSAEYAEEQRRFLAENEPSYLYTIAKCKCDEIHTQNT